MPLTHCPNCNNKYVIKMNDDQWILLYVCDNPRCCKGVYINYCPDCGKQLSNNRILPNETRKEKIIVDLFFEKELYEKLSKEKNKPIYLSKDVVSKSNIIETKILE